MALKKQQARLAKATIKAELFAVAYLANGQNATQAAISAGYSAKTAKQAGHRLLTNVDVGEILARRTADLLQQAHLTAQGVLHEIACIVHADPGKLVNSDGTVIPLHKLDEKTARAVASIEYDDKGNVTKVRFWDKNAAIGHAMRYLGLLKSEAPLVPPSPAQPQAIHAGTVNLTMSPLEEYQKMLAAPRLALEGRVKKPRVA